MPRLYYVTDEAGAVVDFYPTKQEAADMRDFFLKDTEGAEVRSVDYQPTRAGVCKLLKTFCQDA